MNKTEFYNSLSKEQREALGGMILEVLFKGISLDISVGAANSVVPFVKLENEKVEKVEPVETVKEVTTPDRPYFVKLQNTIWDEEKCKKAFIEYVDNRQKDAKAHNTTISYRAIERDLELTNSFISAVKTGKMRMLDRHVKHIIEKCPDIFTDDMRLPEGSSTSSIVNARPETRRKENKIWDEKKAFDALIAYVNEELNKGKFKTVISTELGFYNTFVNSVQNGKQRMSDDICEKICKTNPDILKGCRISPLLSEMEVSEVKEAGVDIYETPKLPTWVEEWCINVMKIDPTLEAIEARFPEIHNGTNLFVSTVRKHQQAYIPDSKHLPYARILEIWKLMHPDTK